MTIVWVLLLLSAGYVARWAQKELNAERFWILPYRQQCRRYTGQPGDGRGGYWRCENTVWRIRWSALAPLSKVCRSCRQADAKRMGRRLGT